MKSKEKTSFQVPLFPTANCSYKNPNVFFYRKDPPHAPLVNSDSTLQGFGRISHSDVFSKVIESSDLYVRRDLMIYKTAGTHTILYYISNDKLPFLKKTTTFRNRRSIFVLKKVFLIPPNPGQGVVIKGI